MIASRCAWASTAGQLECKGGRSRRRRKWSGVGKGACDIFASHASGEGQFHRTTKFQFSSSCAVGAPEHKLQK